MKSKFLQLLIISLFFSSSIISQNWIRLNGPTGAGLHKAIITKEKGEIFSSTKSGKIFYSTDKGDHWKEINAGLQAKVRDNTVLLKESPSGIIHLIYNYKLFYLDRSTETWLPIASGKHFFEIAFSPDGKIYGSDGDTLYISNDGINFNSVQSWSTHSLEFLCLGNNNNFVRLTAGASGKIMKFDDDGTNLREILSTRSSAYMYFHKSSNTLFDLNYSGITYFSKDYGETWSQYLNNSAPTRLGNLIELSDGSLLTYSGKFYRSIDGGINWDNNHPYANNYYENPDDRDIISISNQDEILICDQKNAYLFSPHQTIKKLELPINEPNVNNIVQFGNQNIFVSTEHSNQISIDDGNTWKSIGSINPILFWKDGTMAYTIGDTLVVSSDQFNSSIKHIVPDAYISDNLIMDNNENLFINGYDKNYISFDRGSTWNELTNNLRLHFFRSRPKFSKQNILYVNQFDSIYYSFDYGLNWNKFFAQDFLFTSEVILTKNNFFIWPSRDFNSTYYISKDFGITTEIKSLPNQQFTHFFDEHDNIYTVSKTKLNVSNLLSQSNYDINLEQFGLNAPSHLGLFRGHNDYLYAAIPDSLIYKYDQKMNSNSTVLSGNIVLDEDKDCKKSVNENKTRSFQLELVGTNSKHEIPILPNGEFNAYLSIGTYDLRLKKNSLIWDECNFPKQFNVLANSNTEFKDLMIQPTELCADLYINMVTGRLRRCFDNNYAEFTVRNEGSVSAINSKVTIIFDDYYEILHSSMNPSAINGNVWEFTIPEIADGKSVRINFTFKISCTAELGQEHCIQYLSDNPQACKGVLPILDTAIICERNVGAFDPNDKTAFVNGNQSDAIYKTDSLIKYLIRFQNTGTDTAFNIRITDKLDYHLDWSSVNILSSSHPNSYSINESGLLEFQFKNIMLPDSNIDERASNGYVMYSIKPKLSQLNFGTLISNKADIYFDYNEAVATNTAVVKLTTITKVNDIHDAKALELKAVPNPTEQWTTIGLPDYLRNKNLNVKLSNSSGREVKTQKFTGSILRIERNELPSGIYFLSISDQTGLKAYSKIIFN